MSKSTMRCKTCSLKVTITMTSYCPPLSQACKILRSASNLVGLPVSRQKDRKTQRGCFSLGTCRIWMDSSVRWSRRYSWNLPKGSRLGSGKLVARRWTTHATWLVSHLRNISLQGYRYWNCWRKLQVLRPTIKLCSRRYRDSWTDFIGLWVKNSRVICRAQSLRKSSKSSRARFSLHIK